MNWARLVPIRGCLASRNTGAPPLSFRKLRYPSHGQIANARTIALRERHQKLPAALPAVCVFRGDYQQLAEPGGTSKLLETLFI
jgi:hypothetical protein